MSEDRRKTDRDFSQIERDISLIKKDVDYIKKFIDEDRNRMDNHLEESVLYRKKVDEFNSMKDSFKEHRLADRWIQGLLVTSQVAIIGMLTKLIVK